MYFKMIQRPDANIKDSGPPMLSKLRIHITRRKVRHWGHFGINTISNSHIKEFSPFSATMKKL